MIKNILVFISESKTLVKFIVNRDLKKKILERCNLRNYSKTRLDYFSTRFKKLILFPARTFTQYHRIQ
ncbi:hypothetical protein BpHYR1_037461 [Brachionus plicatilis]|uniref:Uncharacterized protein n=1 Tax=Brachionus plicatilis TaxID=10195 RepID=A0A3M7S6Z9_BRAPC|nr:hypothetical protein BpHYR1_037461 [Brachionus plicatilis]